MRQEEEASRGKSKRIDYRKQVEEASRVCKYSRGCK